MEQLGVEGCIVVLGQSGCPDNMAAIMAAARKVDLDRQRAKRKLSYSSEDHDELRASIKALTAAAADQSAAAEQQLRTAHANCPRLT